jgi:quinolinate synthase
MSAVAITINRYALLDDAECERRIVAARQRLGSRVVILGHHYQRDEIYRHADFTGDSLKLSRHAANSEADYIIFCGVHFMAEVADILSRPEQVSILPDMAAGCSMADMANLANVERAWREIGEVLDPDEAITPVTYINSAADLKAFCGRHGGIVCTSSNARHTLEWGLGRRPKILLFPDQHLGRNTGYRMGIPLDEMAVWDFDQPLGGLTPAALRRAKMILWKGYCSVHQMFQPQHIHAYKKKYPEARVISHPECAFEVSEKSDYVGSTEFIVRTISESAPGTRWLVGTELNLVNRLNERFPDRPVHFMAPTVCMCSTMFRTDPQHLAWVLESLVAGKVVNQIKVHRDDAEPALLALQRMLELPI